MKAFLEIAGAVLTLIGVAVGVYGTYLMTKFTQPFGPLGFMKSMVRTVMLMLLGETDKKNHYVSVASTFAKLKEENKGETLVGVHWVFFGFFLQTWGAILILVDVLIVNLSPHAP